MILRASMFAGSFDANKAALEATLGRSCDATQVGAVRLFDPRGDAVPFGFLVEKGKFVSAAFFEALAEPGQESIVMDDDKRAIAEAFFAELWSSEEAHPTVRFLRDVAGAEARLTWRPQLDGLHMERASMIERAFRDRDLLKDSAYREAVEAVISELESGALRVAVPGPGGAVVQPWIKEAILLYFALRPMERAQSGPYEYRDKIPLQRPSDDARLVYGAVLRRGACLGKGVIMMPSFVNIGANVGPRTMVDTWATVGSCAQVGSDVHLAGGVGIGGVLEPPGARPVVIGNEVFIGSRAVVVEGVEIGDGAVIGAGVVLAASTMIIDMSRTERRQSLQRGYIPPESLVISGVIHRQFLSGEGLVPCAFIIGRVTRNTRDKTALEAWLREREVSV